MEIEFVCAKATDTDFLLMLRKQTMAAHLEKAGIYLSDQEHMARVNKHFEGSKIICTSGKKIGLLKCIETDTTIEILQLQIIPEFQGLGIGKHVLNDVISNAILAKKDTALKVLKENPAKHLYTSIGFDIVGEDQYEFHMRILYETKK